MKKLLNWVFPAFLGLSPTLGAESLSTTQAPTTPRTSALFSFLHEVAEEKFGLNLTADTTNQRTVLKAEDPANGNTLIGLFPLGTKSSQVVSFIESIASGSAKYPIAELESTASSDAASSKISRVVSDKEGNRFLISSFTLPTPQAEPTPPQQSSAQSVTERDHYEILLERFDGFLKKAGEDAAVQGKRLEGFGQKAGKDMEKAGRNIGKLFGRK